MNAGMFNQWPKLTEQKKASLENMGVKLGLCSLAFNLVYFSMLWLFYCVKEENHKRLKVFLHQREASHFYNPLKEAGTHFLALFLMESS